MGYAITTSRIDSLNRMKTLNEGSVFGKLLFWSNSIIGSAAVSPRVQVQVLVAPNALVYTSISPSTARAWASKVLD